jgi:hypothetical protein
MEYFIDWCIDCSRQVSKQSHCIECLVNRSKSDSFALLGDDGNIKPHIGSKPIYSPKLKRRPVRNVQEGRFKSQYVSLSDLISCDIKIEQ